MKAQLYVISALLGILQSLVVEIKIAPPVQRVNFLPTLTPLLATCALQALTPQPDLHYALHVTQVLALRAPELRVQHPLNLPCAQHAPMATMALLKME